ncbi:hypothetical protein [Thalassobacillus sp. CUG 92003]|uniref:hypothetical protein n=1 Tax=Thalassobacillus sp. CUG 92003 TaxID=2736641 RepID=UPI0015E647DA|nr:hypothetical protein [Thalassobacillus sp. CUG 92003]
MAGTWKWNMSFGLLGMGLTFWLSILNNMLQTTLIRATVIFVVFFLLAYLFRLAFGYVNPRSDNDSTLSYRREPTSNQDGKAQSSTPNAVPSAKEASNVIREMLNEDESSQKREHKE